VCVCAVCMLRSKMNLCEFIHVFLLLRQQEEEFFVLLSLVIVSEIKLILMFSLNARDGRRC
jgi:hypothetical protein